jgi:hypothetical protein
MKSYKIKFGYKAVQLKADSFKQAVKLAAPILGYSLTDTMVRPLVKCESI